MKLRMWLASMVVVICGQAAWAAVPGEMPKNGDWISVREGMILPMYTEDGLEMIRVVEEISSGQSRVIGIRQFRAVRIHAWRDSVGDHLREGSTPQEYTIASSRGVLARRVADGTFKAFLMPPSRGVFPVTTKVS